MPLAVFAARVLMLTIVAIMIPNHEPPAKTPNPKLEIRNPKQIPMSQGTNSQNQIPAGRPTAVVLNIAHLNFEFVSDLAAKPAHLSEVLFSGLRISGL